MDSILFISKRENSMQKLAILVIGVNLFSSSIACTTIIVGKNATTDGSILVGRNVDTLTANKAVRFVYHKPRIEPYVFRAIIENKFTPITNIASFCMLFSLLLINKMLSI